MRLSMFRAQVRGAHLVGFAAPRPGCLPSGGCRTPSPRCGRSRPSPGPCRAPPAGCSCPRLAQLPQHAGQRLLFLVAQARGGLVQQQQRGSVHRARAISIRRCGPMARLPARSCMCSAMPMRSRWRAASLYSGALRPVKAQHGLDGTGVCHAGGHPAPRFPARSCRGSSSRAGRCATCRAWQSRATGRPLMTSPRNFTVPRSQRSAHPSPG
jgi:hypothetical protein